MNALLSTLLVLLLTGGPLPLLAAGSFLIPLAWIFLARRPDPSALPHVPGLRDRLWLRLVGGAALGEVSIYLATALLSTTTTGDLTPLVVPFVLPSALLLGTLLGALSGAVSARRHWRAEGVVAYLGLGFLSLGFIEYAAGILATTGMGAAWGLALFFLMAELFGLVLMLLYQFYALEFLAGLPIGPRPKVPEMANESLPHVAVQIACFNEPPDIVERCLRSVRTLDYPADRLRIQLLDDSTDPDTRVQLERLCRALGVQYLARDHRRGFKAGALNDGMASLPPDVELIAIVDADYRVEASFLRRTVPHFRKADIAWVQTPQSYWNEDESPFTRLYCLADAYFYQVIQPVRADADSSIFCGTMGVLRRRALDQVSGWGEQCITEDAEVSLRLYAAGWKSVYLPEVLGAGMAPDGFPALQSQFSRWAFGGMQLLRRNLHLLRSPRLRFRQRVDFVASGVFWMDGAFFFAMAAGLVALLVATWTGIAGSVPSRALLVGVSLTPVLLIADGVAKARLALGRVRRVDLLDAVGVMGFWYALKLTNLRASVRALSGGAMSFARTPKDRGAAAPMTLSSLLRPTWPEMVLAVGIGGAALWAALSAPPGSLWTYFPHLSRRLPVEFLA